MKTWISFDLWGTLIRSNPLYRPERNKLIAEILFPELYMDDSEWDTLIRKTKEFCYFSNEVLQSQMIWQQSILVVVRDFFPLFSREVMIDRFSAYDNENRLLVSKYPPLIYSRETQLVLELLYNNVTMNILSNTGFLNGYILNKVIKDLGISRYFVTCIYSDHVSNSKPSADMFNRIGGAKLGSQYKMHVGDNPYTDGASENVGIDFLHINGDSGKTISHVLNYI